MSASRGTQEYSRCKFELGIDGLTWKDAFAIKQPVIKYMTESVYPLIPCITQQADELNSLLESIIDMAAFYKLFHYARPYCLLIRRFLHHFCCFPCWMQAFQRGQSQRHRPDLVQEGRRSILCRTGQLCLLGAVQHGYRYVKSPRNQSNVCLRSIITVHILGVTNESVVTASHAIFVEKGGYKAPAAVVGLQYKNSAFRETFFNITSGVNLIDKLQSLNSILKHIFSLDYYSAPVSIHFYISYPTLQQQ